MNNIFNKNFFIIALVLLAANEFISWLAFNVFYLNYLVFFIILILTFYFSAKNLINGVYLALSELIVGSQGYLYSIYLFDYKVSIRIGIFVIILSVFIVKLLKKEFSWQIKKNVFYKPFILFISYLFLAVFIGFFKGNSLSNIFFDANGYFYFFYALIFFEAISNKQVISNIINLLAAGIIVLGLKTLLVFVCFAYLPAVDIVTFYKWLRDTRIGEITHVTGNFYRIFFQSHIFSIIGFFVFYVLLIKQNINKLFTNNINIFFMIISVILASMNTVISFSRSNWLGGFIAFIFFLFILIKYFNTNMKKIGKIIAYFFIIIIFDLIMLYLISGNFSGNLIKNRLFNLTNESAGISRLQQLPPLFESIGHNLIIGAGFGKTVTYQTNDPRVLAMQPDGRYTTTAFEWGYLDLLLKLGLIGLFIYGFLLFKIFILSFRLLKNNYNSQPNLLILGFFCGYLSLLGTNLLSPYLNHPLGIGFLLLFMAIINYYETNQAENIS